MQVWKLSTKWHLPFFQTLQNNLMALYPKASQGTLFIPGNHDCYFKEDDQARKVLIADPDPSSLADGSIVTAATSVQNNYFAFCQHFKKSTISTDSLERLSGVETFSVGGKTIIVRSLNSAWTSRIPESRTLLLPIALLKKTSPANTDAAVSIRMLHHPYN